MAVSDLDIHRAAKLLVGRHGDQAPIHAAKRAEALLAAGDPDGWAVWLRILRAVEVLLRELPCGPLH